MNNTINFEQYFTEHERLTYTNVGVSMLPLLRQGKDLFVLEKKKSGRCNVGDVVLYRRKNQYVLHRIVEVRANDYVILGDNCIKREYGITDNNILGVMVSFVRGGKNYSVTAWSYRLYSFILLHTITMRILITKMLRSIKRELKLWME